MIDFSNLLWNLKPNPPPPKKKPKIRSANVNLSGFNRHNTGRGERVSLQLSLQPLGAEDMELPLPTGTSSSPVPATNGSLSQFQPSTNPQLLRSTSANQPLQNDVEPRLKSILKKSSSSVDVTLESGGYVHDARDADIPPAASAVAPLVSPPSTPPPFSPTPPPVHR